MIFLAIIRSNSCFWKYERKPLEKNSFIASVSLAITNTLINTQRIYALYIVTVHRVHNVQFSIIIFTWMKIVVSFGILIMHQCISWQFIARIDGIEQLLIVIWQPQKTIFIESMKKKTEGMHRNIDSSHVNMRSTINCQSGFQLLGFNLSRIDIISMFASHTGTDTGSIIHEIYPDPHKRLIEID